MRKSTVFLLVVALSSAGVSAGLWVQLRAERALNAELDERLRIATATPVTPRPISRPVSELPAVIAPVPAATPVSIPAPTEPPSERGMRETQEDWRDRQRQMMSDPKFREAYRQQERLRLATRRENLMRLIGMSPQQADAVIDLTIDQQVVMQSESWSDTHENAQRAQLRELLGEEKSEQLQTYMETRMSRMQVDQFRTQLTGADVLRDDQVEPLITALHAERSQLQRDLEEFGRTLHQDNDPMGTRRKYMERETELLKETYDRMESSAATILSGTQLQKLQAMLKRDFARREAQLQMQRIQSKFEKPSVSETPAR